ncbi:MAG: hypothetical protein DRJ40_07880 [Thermoprotei archaeon]|nr:MAG: hypothetical protein DRJ40_07880 [Thermoprotei archaeon]
MTLIISLVRKELVQLMRDKRTFFMLFLMPLIVMVMFGLGYGETKTPLPIAVVDLDRTYLSYMWCDVLEETGLFKVVAYPPSIDIGKELMRKGHVYAVVVIPSGFTAKVVQGESCYIEVIIDVSKPAIADIIRRGMAYVAQAYVEALGSRFNLFRIQLQYVTMYGPTVKSIESFMPVIATLLLQLVPMSLISVSICRERERGTFEMLIMTPITRYEIIMGKLLAYFIATLGDLFFTLFIGISVFDVHIKGPITDLILICIVFLLTSLSIGLVISAISRNQLQAQQTAIFFFIPCLLFSGFFKPVALFPKEIKLISYTLPSYYFAEAFYKIMIKGATLADVSTEFTALIVYTVTVLIFSMFLLKMRLE